MTLNVLTIKKTIIEISVAKKLTSLASSFSFITDDLVGVFRSLENACVVSGVI
jgi:hypothetical protein